MTLFDYIVLFVLVASVVISTLRGLVKEILSLVSWVTAFVVANAYGAQLAPMLPSMIPGEAVRLMVAFVALFLGVRILMGLFTMAMDALVKASLVIPDLPSTFRIPSIVASRWHPKAVFPAESPVS